MARNSVHALSQREWQIVELVAQGLPNAEIGQRLCITERTARTHVSHILSKLHMGNRTEVALWYWRQQQPGPSGDVLRAVNRLVEAVRDRDVFRFLENEVTTANEWVQTWGVKEMA